MVEMVGFEIDPTDADPVRRTDDAFSLGSVRVQRSFDRNYLDGRSPLITFLA